MKLLKILGLFILLSFIVSACKKDTATSINSDSTLYSVSMTDAPGNYDAVNIDVRGIELIRDANDEDHEHHSHGDDHDHDHMVIDHDSSIIINVTPHVYNLLDLSNGINVLLASAYVTATDIEQIRLILGPNNSVVVNGVTYPLVIPSGDEVGLKINVHHHLQHGTPFNVLLDFDADKSIVLEGNGTYRLKPVIRIVEASIHGSITGRVQPEHLLAVVTATSPLGSFSTYVNHEGEFKLMGLPAGTYTVFITPGTQTPMTVNNVVVTTGHTTDIGTVSF